MNNLVLTMVNGEVTTTTLQVAEVFGKEHKNVLSVINEYLAVGNQAAKLFTECSYENRGKQYPMYTMNRDGWSLLVMGFTGSMALQWKLKYIAAFNAMEKELSTPKLPATFLEALECLVVKEKALLVAAPKVEYFDKLVDHGHLTNFRDTAKELGIPQNRFMALLEEHGYIYRDNNGKPKPYSASMAYFAVKDFIKGKTSGSQVFITVKGKQRFAKELA